MECSACNISIIKLYFFLYILSSDVNCGMLFCEASGTYQGTASVAGSIVTVGVGGGVQCL